MGESGKVCTTFYGLLRIPKTTVYVYSKISHFHFEQYPLNFFYFPKFKMVCTLILAGQIFKSKIVHNEKFIKLHYLKISAERTCL